MVFEYHSVKVYRDKYTVLAKFYDDEKGKARLFADVVDQDYIDAPIDSYLVMINPGSCKSKEKENDKVKTQNTMKV